MENSFGIESFADDLMLQKEKYVQMTAIVREQQIAIDKNDMESLSKLLDKKRGLLVEIENVDRKISKIKTNWNSIRESVAPELRNKIENVVDKISDVLKELIALEETGRNSMEAKKGFVSNELKKLQTKKKAKNAYYQKGADQSRFLDKEN